MPTVRGFFVVAVALAGSASACAQTPDTGFLDRSVVVDEAEYRYQVFVPRDYECSVPWPVILALHGGEARGGDGVIQTVEGLANAIRSDRSRYRAIAVFPQSPTEGPGWQDLGGRIALAALDETLEEFCTDPARVYLTGYSQGGNGSWYLSYHHPERFAAVVVVCGWIEERRGTTTGAFYPSVAPATSADPFDAVARGVSSLPIWIFHGADDEVVPVRQSRLMASALQGLGADVSYTEFPDRGHYVWNQAYGDESLVAWLFEQSRP